jgi:protein O-mannosyl-transferase
MRKTDVKSDSFFKKYQHVLLWLVLITLTFAVYWQVTSHEFVNFDDPDYVTQNHRVQAGLTIKGIIWAFGFSGQDKTYWHPMTWISHMLDCELFGLSPGKHHLTNLILHLANSLLLFWVFNKMTGAFWRSTLIAALFALHPINVDTVAWVAERKNVLSTFFWMLTILTYTRYTEQPCFSRYALTIIVFTLGLLAKPILVTLPFVLLLLDYWPLGRTRFWPAAIASHKKEQRFDAGLKKAPFLRLAREKIPFLVLAVVSTVVSSLSIQQQMIPTTVVPMKLRLANGLVSYILYIGKLIWPQNLAVLYPYPTHMLPGWQIWGAGLFLVCVSVFTLRFLRRMPYLLIGWLWYLGTLVPVLGLIQGGLWPARADRWAYVPLIGIFIMVTWGVAEFGARWPQMKPWIRTFAAIVLLVLATQTWKKLGYWQNSIALFRHAVKVTQDNYIAHNNLGSALMDQGLIAEAANHYLEALRINPGYETPYNNMGIIAEKYGRIDEAIDCYQKTLHLKPDNELAHYNLGNALAKKGRIDEAIQHYREALRIRPDYVKVHYSLGNLLADQKRFDEAAKHYLKALQIKPDFVEACNNLGNALAAQNLLDEAIDYYMKAIRINPRYVQAYDNLGIALIRKGNITGAIYQFRKAMEINPNYINAGRNLNKALLLQRQNQ